MICKPVSPWSEYEEVARHLLNRFAKHFGFDRVEKKQNVHGKITGTDWEIDAKGVNDGDGGIFIIECRRYTTRRIDKERMAGLAYRIRDLGAAGGVIVSPLGLQKGAQSVSEAEDIVHVELNADSTASDFAIKFLGKLTVGRTFVGRMEGTDH